ncbi:hypothetical protein SARC_10670, partial [Sphaeroforma arctica JP610]
AVAQHTKEMEEASKEAWARAQTTTRGEEYIPIAKKSRKKTEKFPKAYQKDLQDIIDEDIAIQIAKHNTSVKSKVC